MNIKRSRKWLIIGILLMSVLSVGCSGPSVKKLARDDDTAFDKESKVNESTFSEKETRDLAKLAKVWGVVKYYHPEAIAGEINMDYELFRVMSSILEEDADVNLVLLNWIQSLGAIEESIEGKNNIDEETIQLNPSTQWVGDEEYLGEELSTKLTNLLQTTISGRENAYVKFDEEALYGSIENEKNYPTMDPVDTGYRLLGLFRYWNIIEYYYPYKDIIEEDWDKVLTAFIPKFIDGTDHESYALAIAELTTKIHDTHASVVNGVGKDIMSYFGEYWLPASFVEIDGQLVISKVSDDTALENGDIVASIDGTAVKEIIQERKNYQSQSRENPVTSSYLDVFRTKEENVQVTVIRDEREVELQVETTQQAVSAEIEMETKRIEDETIYYINAGQLKDGEIGEIMEKATDTEGLILDMRNHPSSFMLYELAEHLIPIETPFAKVSVPNPAVPGQFYFTDLLVSGQTEETKDTVSNNHYNGKIVLLMNEQTVSQGEFTIMSTRNAENTVVLGRESAGADGNVIPFMLPGNIATTMSGVGIYYPDETPTQRVGIKPDIYLDPTIEGIRAGRDEYLEAAITIIQED